MNQQASNKMTYDLKNNTIEGWMNDADLMWLFKTAQEMESIVEVGCWKGRSTHALLSGCSGTVYAVDHFLGNPHEPILYDEAKTEDIHKIFIKNVGGLKNLKVLKLDSADAVLQFEDNSIDMVFIDVGISREEIRTEINRWLPKAKKIICGHNRRTNSIKRTILEMFGEEDVGWERNEGRGNLWIAKAPIFPSLDETKGKEVKESFSLQGYESNLEEKKRLYEKVFGENNFNHRQALLSLSNIFLSETNYPAAIVYAEAALSLSSSDKSHEDEPHRLLYLAYGLTGNIAKAKEHNLKALDYRPHNEEHIRNMKYYMPLPKVSIVMPTLRKDKIDGIIQTIKDNAGYENYEIILNDEPIGFPKAFNKAVEQSTGELVIVMADDTYPEKNFMQIAVAAMFRNYPELDGLVKLSDGLKRRRELACYWIASKKLLPFLDGKFFHEGYFHNYVDDEITRRTQKLKKYASEDRSVLRHDNAFVVGGEIDEVFLKVTNQERFMEDGKLFRERCKLLGI